MTLVMTAAATQHHPVYTGKVVRILDGKTLQINVRSREVPANTMATARLWGIDLSKDKKHAEAAKKLLTKLALGRNVHVDVYGKTGDWVQVQPESSQTSLSAALVSAGLASRWNPSGIRDFEHHEKELERAENEAKEKKVGIWKSAQQKPATSYAPPRLGTTVNAFPSNLRTMFQDRKGVYWFGSWDEGLYRYDGKTIVRFTKQDGLGGDQVGGIQEDKKGVLYFTTNGGVSKYDGKSFQTLPELHMEAPGKGWRLHKDDLWFTYGFDGGGPSRYDGKTLYCLRFPKHQLEDAKAALRPKSNMYAIYTVYKDKRGYLWFGTGNAGLCRYDGKTINWLYEDHLTNPPGGGSFGIRSIIEDRDGKLWICNTRNRYVVSPTNLPTHGPIDYRAEMGTGSLKSVIGEEWLYFQSVVRGKEGDLWMMPWGGGVFRYDGKKMSHYPVKDGKEDAHMSQIYRDRRGDLWIASQTGGPYKFNGKSFERFFLWPRRGTTASEEDLFRPPVAHVLNLRSPRATCAATFFEKAVWRGDDKNMIRISFPGAVSRDRHHFDSE